MAIFEIVVSIVIKAQRVSRIFTEFLADFLHILI